MKTKFVAALLLLLACQVWSAPLRNAETVLKQPDGSVYSCLMSGDEYYHRAHDSNGYTIIRDLSNDWYVYAQKRGDELVPTSFIPGVDDPAARGLTPDLMPGEALLRQRFQNWRGANRDQYGRAPTIGTIENIVIFIRFAGEPEFGQGLQIYTDMHNSSSQASMKGYFLEESGGQLTVNSTFYPAAGSMVVSWQDTNPRNYYYPQSAGNPGGYPPGPPSDPDQAGYIRLHTMMVNAVNALAGMIPPHLNIDADNDFKVDNLSFICRGNADATSAIFWPHFWQMNAYPATPTTSLMYMGMPRLAEDYNFSMQFPDPLYIGYGGGIDVAEIAHEFSHTLGFPDLYHYIPDGINPCGYWDLMDHCYQVPQHHLAYMKWKYGRWFTITNPLPPAGSSCTLNAVGTNPFDHYMYQMPSGEQIWIEYRQAVGLYESRVYGTGIIVYRVDQTLSPWGNAGGPPDEVYVYRPGVSPGAPDGAIGSAHLAWDVGRTAMNQYTDPAPFSQSMPGFIDAGFNIHSIGTQFMTGAQITFEVGTVIPVIWTGAMNNDWFNPSNWTTGAVPTATDFVIVTWGGMICQIYPLIIPPGFVQPAVCQQLRVEAQLDVFANAQLQVGGNLYSIGRIFMNGNVMQVTGNLSIDDWYAGSWFHCTTSSAAQIRVGGNCLFAGSTNIQLTAGLLIFANLGVSPPSNTFTCDATTAIFNNILVDKPNSSLIIQSVLPFPPIMIFGYLQVSTTTIAGTSLIIATPRQFHIFGNINVAGNSILQVTNPNSIISLMGTPGVQTVFTPNPANYFHHLDINNNSSPSLTSNITVKGDLTINLGSLVANSYTIYLHGNWLNNVGFGAFQKGTSRVVFCGSPTDQSIVVTSPSGALQEDFHVLELNKALGTLNLSIPAQMVQCDAYDWTNGHIKVTDGQLIIQSLLDGYIAGNITCNSPGQITIFDQTGMGDLNANLSIQGGIVHVFCPSATPGSISQWGMQPVNIIMTSGMLSYHDCGVHIGPGAAISTTISGGIISIAGDFLVFDPGFTPTGGTVTVNSPSLPVFIGAQGGSWFHNLDLQSHTDTFLPTWVNGTLNVFNIFNVMHNLNLNGSLNLFHTMSLQGPVNVTVSGVANFIAGSTLNVWDGTMTLAGSYPIYLDSSIHINDGWLDASDHPITINPPGAVYFGSPGPGFNGKLSCATLTANSPGTFTPPCGTLELANTDPNMVFSLSVVSGNWLHNLDLDVLTSVQAMTDLYVNGNMHIISGQLIMDNTGKTIYMQGNWTNDIPTTGFVCGNSTVEFSSAGTCAISANGGTEQFYTLNILGVPGAIMMDNINVLNTLSITSGALHVNGKRLSVNGNTNVNVGGILDLNSGSIMETGNNKQVMVMGSLQCGGVAGNLATMRGQTGAYWHLTAQAGSNISVRYTDFRNLRSSGVTIQNGAVISSVDDFDNCIFRDGANAATFLTINNNQTLNITGISFPTITASGKNIAKTANTGTINVLSSSGSFAGPLYENDPYTRINWTGYDPNLIVQTFAVSDASPYVADQVSYNVTIKNDSPHPVQQTFKIHLFKNRSSAPGWNETGDYEHVCPTLAPNATHSYTFTGVYSMTAEDWTSWLLIDPEGAVQETNETDNRDSETLTWHDLPLVGNVSITNNGGGTAQISWNYSLWVSRFKIYYTDDPSAAYTYLNSTSNFYYDINLSDQRRFYHIVAERDVP